MRITCRTHRRRGRAGNRCPIPATIGSALLGVAALDPDAARPAGVRAGDVELDEETLAALRLLDAQGMLAAPREQPPDRG